MIQRDDEVSRILRKYDFNWDFVDVTIGGKSSIDLQQLSINSLDNATKFLDLYGYDISNSEVKLELKNIFDEAIKFIEEVLIPDPFTKKTYLKIPDEIKNEKDIRNLILISSNRCNDMQLWSCAILRVMHTIAHINNDISLKFFPEIQRQILSRIWSAIYVNSDGEKFFGQGDDAIKIYDVEIKAKKERNSVILKLLHKIENVAADVFDNIGVRIITYDKLDVMLILRFLRKSGIFNFCNIKPSRSINHLINLDIFKEIVNKYIKKYIDGEINRQEFEMILKEETELKASIKDIYINDFNKYSSKDYKTIQFTIRQMIRMKYPYDSPNSENYSFFFPYEMQIVDLKTHLENMFGRASHEKYKEKQLIAARKRVLGKLLK
jgi:uncharacterized protein (TIGR04562 family)